MSLRDRRFERAMGARVRAAVRRTPALRREQRRVRSSRRRDISPATLRGLLTVLLAVGLTSLGTHGASLDALLGLLALWCAGFTADAAQRLRFHLYLAPEILVLALQPIPDDAIFSQQWRRFVRRTGWILADIAAALIVVCAFAQASFIQWLTVVPCALALWMSVVSIATIFVRLRPRANFGALSSGLFLLIVSTVVAGFYLPDATARMLDGASGPLYLLPPFGWICYVVRQAVLGPEALPLLILLPVALLAPGLHRARQRLRLHYQLFASEPPSAPDATSPEDASEPLAPDAAPAATPELGTGPMPSRPKFTPEQLAVVRTAWQRPARPWGHADFVERWVVRHLSRRERDLAELLTAGNTDWTLTLRRATILMLASLLAAVTLGPSGHWLCYVGLYFAMTTGVPLLGPPCVGLSIVRMAGSSFPACAGLPLGFRETARLLLKIGIIRILALVPIGLTAGAALGELTGHQWTSGLAIALKVVFLLIGWQPIGVALQFSQGTNDTRGSTRRQLKFFVAFGPIALAMIGLSATAFAVGPSGAALCIGATGLLGWATLRLYQHFYDGNAFDLMHGEPQ